MELKEKIARELYLWFGSCGEPDAPKFEEISEVSQDRYYDAAKQR
jgi:hypothetical protein